MGTKISELNTYTPLDGTEYVETIVTPYTTGTNRRITTQQIANLGGGGETWGSITGTLSAQTDLQSALDARVPETLSANETITLAGDFFLRLLGIAGTTPRLVIDGVNNTRKSFQFRTGNLTRWDIHIEGDEAGSNAEADLHFERYDDAGAFIAETLTISRATGVVNFTVGPTAPTAAQGTNTTQIATTAFVQANVSNLLYMYNNFI